MMQRIFTALTIAIPVLAGAAQASDLRQFSVGMPVSDLPRGGYGDFTCTARPDQKLAGWLDFKSCPVTNHLWSVSFKYDDSHDEKTQVGGQAVNLSVLIDNDASVAGLRIDTDPHTRLYMHKKAYLFALQVRARFGEDGWVCRKADPTPTQQPVGGVFVNEHCEKTTADRHFVLDRQLYRDPAKKLQEFSDATQLTILKASLTQ